MRNVSATSPTAPSIIIMSQMSGNVAAGKCPSASAGSANASVGRKYSPPTVSSAGAAANAAANMRMWNSSSPATMNTAASGAPQPSRRAWLDSSIGSGMKKVKNSCAQKIPR